MTCDRKALVSKIEGQLRSKRGIAVDECPLKRLDPEVEAFSSNGARPRFR